MHKQILILLTAFVLITQITFGASVPTGDDPAEVKPVGGTPAPANIVTPEGASAGAVSARAGVELSDVASVLSDHESDDDELKTLVAEARDLGFSADAGVKKNLRGKRHQRKIEIASAKAAEREAKKAAFLAKIGGAAESKDASSSVCGAGAGGAAAASAEGYRDDECKGAGGAFAAKDATALINPSVERLAWMTVSLHRRAENILQVMGAIKEIDKSERVAFAQKLKTLITQRGFMPEGLSVFMEVSKDLPPARRHKLMSDLENLGSAGFVLNSNNIRALAKQVRKSKDSIVEILRRFGALVGIKTDAGWGGDIQDIIDIDTVVKSSSDETPSFNCAKVIALKNLFSNSSKIPPGIFISTNGGISKVFSVSSMEKFCPGVYITLK